MKTLEQIKNDYSLTNTRLDWNLFVSRIIENSNTFGEAVAKVELHLDHISRIYATECVKASLEKASEKAKIIHKDFGWYNKSCVNKESITNPDNIVLL